MDCRYGRNGKGKCSYYILTGLTGWKEALRPVDSQLRLAQALMVYTYIITTVFVTLKAYSQLLW